MADAAQFTRYNMRQRYMDSFSRVNMRSWKVFKSDIKEFSDAIKQFKIGAINRETLINNFEELKRFSNQAVSNAKNTFENAKEILRAAEKSGDSIAITHAREL